MRSADIWYADRVRGTEEHPPSDEELAQPALILARRFIQRWDLYARQLDDGRYICVREPLNTGHLLAHLRGEVTLGSYVLDADSRARYVVFDADDERGLARLGDLAVTLATEDVPSYLEASRRGGHLWLFFAQMVAGKDARAFGRGLLAAHRVDDVELFPKQDRLRGGPGSLIRLPFGVHRRAGRRYGFLTADDQPLASTLREQLFVLSSVCPVPDWAFEAYRSFAPVRPLLPVSRRPNEPDELLSKRIKASVGVRDFVEQYVELSTSGVGLCPFHDDQHSSFSVNEQEGYWQCFAGCGGGSIIDFWARWRENHGQNLDFVALLGELADMLL
jgi:hypothetical protein